VFLFWNIESRIQCRGNTCCIHIFNWFFPRRLEILSRRRKNKQNINFLFNKKSQEKTLFFRTKSKFLWWTFSIFYLTKGNVKAFLKNHTSTHLYSLLFLKLGGQKKSDAHEMDHTVFLKNIFFFFLYFFTSPFYLIQKKNLNFNKKNFHNFKLMLGEALTKSEV
jgi:hypothetical protein